MRTLLVAMLAVAAFFGGIYFERERRRREDDEIHEKAWRGLRQMGFTPPIRERLREAALRNAEIRRANPYVGK